MIITVAGIKRSGSTWMYNVVRLICEANGPTKISGHDPEIDETKPFNVVKRHPFHNWLYQHSDVILTSTRPEAEIRESLKRFEGDDSGYEWYEAGFNLWNRKSSYCMDYKDVGNIKAVKAIAGALHLPCDPHDILEEVDSIKPKAEYDPVTFLFPNHIS